MSVDSQADVVAALRAMGWRTRTQAETSRAVSDYQRGYNLGAALVVDGVPGDRTRAALTRSMARGGALSAHFDAHEFACKCGGRYATCRRIWVTREQLTSLEAYRTKAGATTITSGCRCPSHNKAVGGATKSQHMAGRSSDVPGVLTVAQVKALRAFGGIGYKASTGKVLHVDTRPGSRVTPTVWTYA